MIPVKIITKEQAFELELEIAKVTPVARNGSGNANIVLVATGKVGNPKAEKIEIVDIKTGEKHVLFDKGKSFKFKGFYKKVL